MQHAYDTLANGARMTSMTYPNATVLHDNYGTADGLNDVISRLDHIIDGSTTVESYQYLGLSTVVVRLQAQSGIELAYVNVPGDAYTFSIDGGDQYTGLDRFGRVIDQNWIDTSNTSVDRYQYEYDRNSNVTEKNNLLHTAFDEAYTYDANPPPPSRPRTPPRNQKPYQPISNGHLKILAGGGFEPPTSGL